VFEEHNCVKGSRIRNPVPPSTAEEEVLLEEVLGKLRSVVRRSAVSKFSKGCSVFNPRYSEAEKIRTVRVEWSEWRMERIFRAQQVKLVIKFCITR